MTSAEPSPKDHSKESDSEEEEDGINPFCETELRRSVVKTFVFGIVKNPTKYSFVFTMDDFYVNISSWMKEVGFKKVLNDFRTFWATSGNRQLLIKEFRYAIGEVLSEGHVLSTLPSKAANGCIHLYRAMSHK